MSCLYKSQLIYQSRHILKKRLHLLSCHNVSSLPKHIEESNLETKLNVLALDDAMIQESLLSNEKLENIFSKIRQSTTKKQDMTQDKILKFEDLFPLTSVSDNESMEYAQSDTQDIEQEEMMEDAIVSMEHTVESVTTEHDSVHIAFMTQDDILNTP